MEIAESRFQVYELDKSLPLEYRPQLVDLPEDSVHMHIDFVHKIKHRFTRYPETNDLAISREEVLMEEETVVMGICVNPKAFFEYEKAHDIIFTVLNNLKITQYYRDETIDGQVLLLWETIVNGEFPDANILTLRVDIVSVITYDERQLVQQVMEESMAEGASGMVPARLSSIRSLKRKRVEDKGGDQSCMVCLEELPKGSKVTCMPCSHVFHGDCIETWLLRSHVCPICRFKMPRASN